MINFFRQIRLYVYWKRRRNFASCFCQFGIWRVLWKHRKYYLVFQIQTAIIHAPSNLWTPESRTKMVSENEPTEILLFALGNHEYTGSWASLCNKNFMYRFSLVEILTVGTTWANECRWSNILLKEILVEHSTLALNLFRMKIDQ